MRLEREASSIRQKGYSFFPVHSTLSVHAALHQARISCQSLPHAVSSFGMGPSALDILDSQPRFGTELLARHYPFSKALLFEFQDRLPWDELSGNWNLPWSIGLITDHEERWDWDELELNCSLPWGARLLDEFGDRLAWESTALYASGIWTAPMISRYEDRLDWTVLCMCSSTPWTEDFIDRHQGQIDWEQLCANGAVPWTQNLMEKYSDRLCWEGLSRYCFYLISLCSLPCFAFCSQYFHSFLELGAFDVRQNRAHSIARPASQF